MGAHHEIIQNLEQGPSPKTETGNRVTIRNLRNGIFPDKKLDTIAKVLLRRILPFFITDQDAFPKIVIREHHQQLHDTEPSICLNRFVENQLGHFIEKIEPVSNSFSFPPSNGDQFSVHIFKMYTPRNLTNRISMVAHKREVLRTQLSDHIPEFEDAFDEEDEHGSSRKYIVNAYVCGDYLDTNVSVERGGFKFKKNPDIEFPIGQTQIEETAADIVKKSLGSDITNRQDQRKKIIQDYVDQKAPWFKRTLSSADISKLPCRPTEEQIDSHLHAENFRSDSDLKTRIHKLMSSNVSHVDDQSFVNIIEELSDSSKEKLAEYVVFRKFILDLFKRNLEYTETGKYSYEESLHDIIFRRKEDSNSVYYEDHNLWLIDERLNFTQYVASDKELGNRNKKRPDLLAFDSAHMFRGDNAPSSPITIFEFKRPNNDKFADHSSNDDPIDKIIRYVKDIRDGRYRTPEGRQIEITENTPAYGFVVCDINEKVKNWLYTYKEYRPLPDNLGWYRWSDNNNLMIQVLKWEKILQDAEIRNKIYFKKLGLV